MLSPGENLASTEQFSLTQPWPDSPFIDTLLNSRSELKWTVVAHTVTTPGWEIFSRSDGFRCLQDHLIYLALGGVAVGAVGDRAVELNAGDWLWLDPGVPHRFRNRPGETCFDVFHLRFRLIDRRKDILQGASPRLVRRMQHQLPLLDHLRREYRGTARLRHSRLKALLAEILIDAGERAFTHESRALNDTQRHTIERLSARRSHHVTPAELARTLHLNPDYFRRLFTASYGVSPRHWIVHQRLEAARVLLLESLLSVTEIAEQTGYADVFQFSRAFKRTFGASPLAYRRNA